MKILYIDIYFIINFTTDLLALYFAGSIAKVGSSMLRLIISSLFGAAAACFAALVNIGFWQYAAMLLLSAVIMTVIYARPCNLLRRAKLLVSFLVTETLLGGSVSFLFSLMEKYVSPLIKDDGGAENRDLLLLSMSVLLSYGVIRLSFSVLRGSISEKNAEFTVKLLGKTQSFTGFIDSGNLVIDPISGSPVILIKRSAFDLTDKSSAITDTEDRELQKRIRIIPTSSIGGKKILYGIRVDEVEFAGKHTCKYTGSIIALDECSGDYHGYNALIPSSII